MATKTYRVTASKRVAFLGLGVMGYPMAGHLKAAGHDVTVYNRTRTKAEQWVKEFGGRFALTPREAAKDADIVFACVGNDNDIRSVVFGDDGALAGMRPGSFFVDNTTDSANVARELHAKFSEAGIGFVDAPVSGGQAGAVNGVLTVMCGGDKEAFEAVKDVVDAYACAVTYMGPSGNGQLTKMCNQICIAGVVQGLAEALAFGLNAGLPMDLVVDVIGKGAAGSWQMANRGKTMIRDSFDFGFAVDWMRKDLAIAMQEAKSNGSELPMTALVDSFYAELQAKGGNRWDTSSLIARLPHTKVGS